MTNKCSHVSISSFDSSIFFFAKWRRIFDMLTNRSETNTLNEMLLNVVFIDAFDKKSSITIKAGSCASA